MSEWHAVFLELAVFGLNNVHFIGDGVDESVNARRVRRVWRVTTWVRCSLEEILKHLSHDKVRVGRRARNWLGTACRGQGLVIFKHTNEPLVPLIWCYGEVI
jgi:hypothetical protein